MADEIDAANAHIYEANKDKTADQVKAEARASYDRLEIAIAACSEEDLNKPHPRSPSALLWQVVPGNGHGHLGHHLLFLHAGKGDEEAAQAAEDLVYDLDRAEFPGPKSN